MEFEFPSTLILVIISIILLLVLLKKPTKSERDLNRVPGPRRLPLIGNLHLLLLLLSKSLPPRLFRDLAAKYGPLMRLQLGGVPFLIVSSVEGAKDVFKTNDIAFANRPPMQTAKIISYNYTNLGFAPYSEHWRNLRKLCTLELLSARRVKSFRHIREEVNASLGKWVALHEGSPADMSERLYLASYDITSRATVGRETAEKRMMTAVLKALFNLSSGFNLGDLYPSITFIPFITGLSFRLRKLFKITDRILGNIVSQHRDDFEATKPGRSEDLVDVLLKYQRDENVHLTTNSIKGVVMDLLGAGADTSATAVDWAMSEMIRNPKTLKKAQDEVRRVFDDKGYVDEEKFEELKYLKLVIKEMLRLHPPLPFLVPRINSEKCTINGYEIPAETRVMVNAWALGRDPKHWKDAEMFIPERFEDSSVDFKGNNLEFIPFGSGRRMCPGMLFGLANVEFLLAVLLYHFDWEMPNGMKAEELDMSEDFGATMRRKIHLLMIPTVRRPFPAA